MYLESYLNIRSLYQLSKKSFEALEIKFKYHRIRIKCSNIDMLSSQKIENLTFVLL